MKKIILVLIIILITHNLQAQSNTFPSSGKVGIGTTSPTGMLHINGELPEIRLTSTRTYPVMAIRGNKGTWLFGYGGVSGSENISIGTQDKTGSRTLSFAAGGLGRMKILANGNVGIGTTSPKGMDLQQKTGQ